jgi:mRNA interferase YafQ
MPWEYLLMLRLKALTRFKKDLKKYKHHPQVISELNIVLKVLLSQHNLTSKYCDHPLSGNWIGSRECHVKPDVLLIYRIDIADQLLFLERIGSHSELF